MVLLLWLLHLGHYIWVNAPVGHWLNNTLCYDRDWLIEVMRIWAAMPNCRFWTFQWATLMSRVLKHSHDTFDHWEDFVPTLFTFYLQSFEVGSAVFIPPGILCYCCNCWKPWLFSFVGVGHFRYKFEEILVEVMLKSEVLGLFLYCTFRCLWVELVRHHQFKGKYPERLWLHLTRAGHFPLPKFMPSQW